MGGRPHSPPAGVEGRGGRGRQGGCVEGHAGEVRGGEGRGGEGVGEVRVDVEVGAAARRLGGHAEVGARAHQGHLGVN